MLVETTACQIWRFLLRHNVYRDNATCRIYTTFSPTSSNNAVTETFNCLANEKGQPQTLEITTRANVEGKKQNTQFATFIPQPSNDVKQQSLCNSVETDERSETWTPPAGRQMLCWYAAGARPIRLVIPLPNLSALFSTIRLLLTVTAYGQTGTINHAVDNRSWMRQKPTNAEHEQKTNASTTGRSKGARFDSTDSKHCSAVRWLLCSTVFHF